MKKNKDPIIEFIDKDGDQKKFYNHYFALIDNKVVTHNKNITKLLEEVREKYPGKTPYIRHMLPPGTYIL